MPFDRDVFKLLLVLSYTYDKGVIIKVMPHLSGLSNALYLSVLDYTMFKLQILKKISIKIVQALFEWHLL